MIMLCPSRGRPGNITELRGAWDEVTDSADLLVAVDDDDPMVAEYEDVRVLSSPRRLGPILNALAVEAAAGYEAVGFLGDDHRPRTPGWDTRLLAALDGRPGVAYGNDLHQGGKLPTAVVISSVIIQELGYMVPPVLEHLYLDDFWRRLGLDLGHLEYLPDVIIEHCHPNAGKASWDDGYERVNSPGQDTADSAAYGQFMSSAWPTDLTRLRAGLDCL